MLLGIVQLSLRLCSNVSWAPTYALVGRSGGVLLVPEHPQKKVGCQRWCHGVVGGISHRLRSQKQPGSVPLIKRSRPPLALVHWQDCHTHWLRRAADSTLTSCRSSLSLFGLQPLPELGAASYCAVPGRFVGPFFFLCSSSAPTHFLLTSSLSLSVRPVSFFLSSSHSCSPQSPSILRDPLRPKHREGIATSGALQSVGSIRVPARQTASLSTERVHVQLSTRLLNKVSLGQATGS